MKEGYKFDTQGGKMKTNQVLMVGSMKAAVVKDNLSVWDEAKNDMNLYIDAVNAINCCFNFESTAKPSSMKTLTFRNLDLTLNVPANIDYHSIVGNEEIEEISFRPQKHLEWPGKHSKQTHHTSLQNKRQKSKKENNLPSSAITINMDFNVLLASVGFAIIAIVLGAVFILLLKMLP